LERGVGSVLSFELHFEAHRGDVMGGKLEAVFDLVGADSS
jgi:hypothetical protein